MTSTGFKRGLFLCCLLLLCASPGAGIEVPGSLPRRPGLSDFVLGRINPANIDYGAELERKRRRFLHRLEDPQLWAEAAELALILCGWTLVARQRGERRRRELISAELLAQYHNALAEATIRLEQAIADNNALRETARTSIVAPAADQSAIGDPAAPAATYLSSNFSPRSRSRRAGTTESPQTSTRMEEPEQRLSDAREREKLLQKELERIPPQGRGSLPKPKIPSRQGKEPR